MAAIVYFEKVLESDDSVVYRYGADEERLAHSIVISKLDRRPVEPVEVTFGVELAFGGILRGYRRLGSWPERGSGCT